MSPVWRRWCTQVCFRALIIQLVAFGLVAVFDGAERAVVGGWSHWLPDVFRLHLHGLGLYMVLAVLWTDRDWRLGGERLAFRLAGFSISDLGKVTSIVSLLWGLLWFGVSGIVSIDDAASWEQIESGQTVRWAYQGEKVQEEMIVTLEKSRVAALETLSNNGDSRIWTQAEDGRWGGLSKSVASKALPDSSLGEGVSTLGLIVLLARSVLLAFVSAISVWLGVRYAWLVVGGTALISLVEIGIHSAVLRGFWPPLALSFVPAILLVGLMWGWARAEAV